MVLTASFVLAPETGFVVSVPAQCKALSRVEHQHRDVRPTRLRRPHRCASSSRNLRPSHPAPNVRDDREAPLLRSAGWLESVMLCLAIGEAKYFYPKGWTQARPSARARALICPSGKLAKLNSGEGCSGINIRCKTCSATDNAVFELTNSDGPRRPLCRADGLKADIATSPKYANSDAFRILELSSFWTNTGNAALWGPELVFEALPSIMNCPVLCEEFLRPVPRVGLLDCFQHNPALRIISKRSDNDPAPDADVTAASAVREYRQILGVDWSLDDSIHSRFHQCDRRESFVTR